MTELIHRTSPKESQKTEAAIRNKLEADNLKQAIRRGLVEIALKSVTEDDPWQAQALCATEDIDPELFDTRNKGEIGVKMAKTVCDACKVSAQCLETATNPHKPENFLMWGGLTEKQRKAMRKRVRPTHYS